MDSNWWYFITADLPMNPQAQLNLFSKPVNVRNPAKPNLKNGSKHFHDPSWRSSLEISMYELWRTELWDYRFCSKQNGDQKAESFESNMAKFRQSRHGSLEWNIFPRYFSKLSDIWHFTKCKIQRENCNNIRRRFEAEISLRHNVNNSLICMRYAQICQDKMAAVGLDINFTYIIWGLSKSLAWVIINQLSFWLCNLICSWSHIHLTCL